MKKGRERQRLFFFQAEDGIRDADVTGVQTCALPIFNRIFDYARQETVDAIWITGGNPRLGRGRQENRSLAVQLRPFGDQRLTLNLGYREQVATGGVIPFPELTPAIEAAFPERVTRDPAGRLISVDARPINLE